MRTLIVAIALLASIHGQAQLPDSLRAHLDTALTVMQTRSLYAKGMPWKKIRRKAHAMARGADNKAALSPAIAWAFMQLNDHHGMFAQYDTVVRNTDSSAIKRYTPLLIAEWAKGPVIKTAMIGTVAYVRIPGMPGASASRMEFYTNWLTDSIRSLAAKQPTGWIIDLRMNTGGNLVPMIQGLASFFGDGILSYAMDRNRHISSTSQIKQGIFYADTTRVVPKHPAPGLQQANVAVITGPGTASSGEITAIHFQQRNNTRLFGEQTAGLATATTGFPFNNDNSYFLLATDFIADVHKRALPSIVTPHVTLKHNDLFTDLRNDNAVSAALSWLNSRPQ